MTPPYGFGIVGAGVIGRTHAAAIALLPDGRLRAVADVDAPAAQRLAQETGADATTIERLLERNDVDVVCVCVPSGRHAEVGVRAAAAGKHVVVEKPIDVTLDAADRLIDACRRSGVVLSVISQHRFDDGVVRLREAIVAGRLGRIVLADAAVKWFRSQRYYDSAGWRGTWELDGGGALMNQGIHSVDLLHWLAGPVASVTAHVATMAHDVAVEDVAVAMLRFASGASGTIVATTAAFPGLAERIEISGTKGSVVLEAGNVLAWELADERGDVGDYGTSVRLGPVQRTTAAAMDAHAAQLRDVVDAIARGAEPRSTGADGRAAVEIVLAAYESARIGSAVHLPMRRPAESASVS